MVLAGVKSFEVSSSFDTESSFDPEVSLRAERTQSFDSELRTNCARQDRRAGHALAQVRIMSTLRSGGGLILRGKLSGHAPTRSGDYSAGIFYFSSIRYILLS